jgi:hypothetical protein
VLHPHFEGQPRAHPPPSRAPPSPGRARGRRRGQARKCGDILECDDGLAQGKTKVPVVGDGVPIRDVRASTRRGIPPCGCHAGLDPRTGLDPPGDPAMWASIRWGGAVRGEGGNRGTRWAEQHEEAEGEGGGS